MLVEKLWRYLEAWQRVILGISLKHWRYISLKCQYTARSVQLIWYLEYFNFDQTRMKIDLLKPTNVVQILVFCISLSSILIFIWLAALFHGRMILTLILTLILSLRQWKIISRSKEIESRLESIYRLLMNYRPCLIRLNCMAQQKVNECYVCGSERERWGRRLEGERDRGGEEGRGKRREAIDLWRKPSRNVNWYLI